MEMCWKFHPKDRPSFVDIVELFLPKTNDAFKKVSAIGVITGPPYTICRMPNVLYPFSGVVLLYSVRTVDGE